MTVDTASGNVTDATMEQTTGNPLLDKSATTAFRKWRFKPGTASKVRVPITYEPAPAPEETPAREHATPKAAERPAADLMSLSSAKAVAVSAPFPAYPYEALSRHLMGSGVCVVTVDTASGKVTDATMEQSTGSPILDNATVSAFKRWRFKPGTAPKRKITVTFSP